MAGSTTLSTKLPPEKVFVDFNFAPLFATGVTLVIASVVATVYDGTDATPQAIVSGATAISGMVAAQFIINGVAGTDYLLTCTGTGSDATVEQICVVLPVVIQRLG